MNTRFESGVYLFVCQVFDTESDLTWHEYSDGYKAGYVLVGDKADSIYVVFSYPRESDDCYLMISDGDPEELATEMAALQEYNENVSHLCKDHTVPTKNSYLTGVGWSSYLITAPGVSYRDFPSSESLDGREIRFHLALPLTERERELKIEFGVNALFEKFEKTNRDTITFDQV